MKTVTLTSPPLPISSWKVAPCSSKPIPATTNFAVELRTATLSVLGTTLTGVFSFDNVAGGWTIDYNYQGLNQIALIPEPSTVIPLVAILTPWLIRRRRRRSWEGMLRGERWWQSKQGDGPAHGCAEPCRSPLR
ncbi:MAG: PEP-CTERM sorting domain-containing protein [Roseibacillus sp.]